MTKNNLKKLIATALGTPVSSLHLYGQGMCNNAWEVLTADGNRYLVKQERTDKKEEEANDLCTEAKLLATLNNMHPLMPVPQVAFAHENPPMYGYRFIEGRLMRDAWPTLTGAAQENLCHALGIFHATLSTALTRQQAASLGIAVNGRRNLDAATQAEIAHLLGCRNTTNTRKHLVSMACTAYDATGNAAVFGFCHNDSHHENILVRDDTLAAVVDFGDAGWLDLHNEFARYALDYPAYFDTIIASYEKAGGPRLSRKRIVAIAILEAMEEMSAAQEVRMTQLLEPYMAWPLP